MRRGNVCGMVRKKTGKWTESSQIGWVNQERQANKIMEEFVTASLKGDISRSWFCSEKKSIIILDTIDFRQSEYDYLWVASWVTKLYQN